MFINEDYHYEEVEFHSGGRFLFGHHFYFKSPTFLNRNLNDFLKIVFENQRVYKSISEILRAAPNVN